MKNECLIDTQHVRMLQTKWRFERKSVCQCVGGFSAFGTWKRRNIMTIKRHLLT